MQGAWKVGLLVVVFAGLFVSALIFLGQTFGKKDVVTYHASMPDAGGVVGGAKILMSGVRVGTVTEVKLAESETDDGGTHAELTLEMDPKVKFRKGSTLRLPSSLLSLGENPVIVVPGRDKGYMDPKVDRFVGVKDTILDTSLPEVKSALGKLEEMAQKLQVIADRTLSEERMGKIDALLDEFKKLASTYDKLGTRVDGLIAKNSDKMTAALENLRVTLDSARQTSQMIAQMIKEGNYNDKIATITDNLNKTTENANGLVADMRKFINNPKLNDSLNKTMDNVATMSDSGTRIAADAEVIAKNGVEISQKVNTFTDKANELADSAKDALDQLKKLIGKAPSANKLNLTASLDLMHETKPNRYRTDLEVGFSLGENRVYAGLFDAFESNKITMQVGQRIMPRLEVRYGIYASKPGLGVEYEIARGFALRADTFDINNPRADVRARFDLGGGFYGWLGAQQLFKRNALTVGIGFRKK